MDGDKNVMPTSREFTEEELERSGTEFLPQLPSYRATDRSIESCDIIPLFKMMKWPRTDSQIKQYIVFTDKVWGGRMTFEQWRGVMLNVHDRIGYLRWLAETLDGNRDGYISREEYEFGMDHMTVHEPTLAKVPYEQLLVREANVDRDGQINIDEMIRWLDTIDNRIQR